MLVNKTMLLCNISFLQQTHNKHQLCRHIAHVQTANHCQGEDLHTGCPRRNVKYFRRVFLMLNYTDITQNTYIQS